MTAIAKDIKLIGGARDRSFLNQVISYFEIHGCPNRKQKKRKHLRGSASGERAKEKKD